MSKKSEEALNALIKPIRKWLAGESRLRQWFDNLSTMVR